jgi:hypothetical protein
VILTEQVQSEDRMENGKETELGDSYQVQKDNINSCLSPAWGVRRKQRRWRS